MWASLGSLPVMFCPVLLKTPLPASGKYCESLPVWAPYFAWLKLQSLERLAPSLATQPIIGIVSIARAPCDLASLMKLSPSAPAVALLEPMLSKYQSEARLVAFNCQ